MNFSCRVSLSQKIRYAKTRRNITLLKKKSEEQEINIFLKNLLFNGERLRQKY